MSRETFEEDPMAGVNVDAWKTQAPIIGGPKIPAASEAPCRQCGNAPKHYDGFCKLCLSLFPTEEWSVTCCNPDCRAVAIEMRPKTGTVPKFTCLTCGGSSVSVKLAKFAAGRRAVRGAA